MLERRALLGLIAGLPITPASHRHRHPAPASEPAYAAFLRHIREKALRRGVTPAILDRALALPGANSRILALDRRQPEFTTTWQDYSRRVLSDTKIRTGRRAFQDRAATLDAIASRYQVDPRIVVAIWGVESAYGSHDGRFGVVDALATLAYASQRPAFFTAELISALLILQHGDVDPGRMLGSYAGAMGQPQFMPSSYLKYAVDFDGDGRRDIWSSDADVLASIANYLARNGWVAGAPWGQPVSLPPDLAPAGLAAAGSHVRRDLGGWMRLGVRRSDGAAFQRSDAVGALLLPAGRGGQAFMVYRNFEVIKRYNASDFYALAVGLLGAAIG